MSSTQARFIFVLVFVINCLLWSQSRYSHAIQTKSTLLRGESLVKRFSFELLNPDRLEPDNVAESCRPLLQPTTLQCAHVEAECPPPDTLLSIDYLHRYFCTEISLRPLVFTGLIIWLIFLFSTLGITASDFFTPNLATIAQLLGLDENVAGVTFLAFGNGSPDVFSTFSAMRAQSGSLAIGELLGAASFIVSCVVGSMCIIKPFKVHPGPFLRDVGFFTAAVSLVLYILWDGVIKPVEAWSLVGLYLIYVAVVVVGSWWERRRENRRNIETLMRSEYQDEPLEFNNPYRDDDSSSATLRVPSPVPPRTRAVSSPTPLRLNTNLPQRPYSMAPSPSPSHHAQLPSFSLIGALEFRDVVSSLQHQASGSSLSMFESPITPYAGGHYHSRTISTQSRPRSPRSSITVRDEDPRNAALNRNSLPLDDRSRPRVIVSSPTLSPRRPSDDPQMSLTTNGSPPGDYFTETHHTHPHVPSIFRTPASPTLSETESEEQIFAPLTKKQRAIGIISKVFHILFPTLHHLRDQSILGQIACIFAAPAVTLLTLTLPVVVTPYESKHASREKSIHGGDGRLVDFEEEGVERVLIAEEEIEENMHELSFNKWLMSAQCICGPLFCARVLFGGMKHGIWLTLATSVAGFAAALLVVIFADKGNSITARMTRCSMGFVVAVVWIMAIADEVVNVLQTFGHIFGLSDAIIGLTIFAVGNSLADLVANMSVAVFAPIMGFSACFGGPMLNILLGVGISGSYIIHQSSQPYTLELTTTLLVSSIGLLCLLAATLIFVPLNNYFLTRRWGILLIASYLIIMVINVVVEIRS